MNNPKQPESLSPYVSLYLTRGQAEWIFSILHWDASGRAKSYKSNPILKKIRKALDD